MSVLRSKALEVLIRYPGDQALGGMALCFTGIQGASDLQTILGNTAEVLESPFSSSRPALHLFCASVRARTHPQITPRGLRPLRSGCGGNGLHLALRRLLERQGLALQWTSWALDAALMLNPLSRLSFQPQLTFLALGTRVSACPPLGLPWSVSAGILVGQFHGWNQNVLE